MAAEYDHGSLSLAIAKAKMAGVYGLETALRDAFRLISAVPHLQGDVQFEKYKESLAPILNILEQKQ